MMMHRLTALIVTGLLVGAILAAPAAAGSSQTASRAQEAGEPQLLFTGLQLADHVRYAVTLVRPLSATVANVRVDVELPPGAELTETLQTPNRSVFLGVDGDTLSWAAPYYEPGDPVDAFTFRLARPLTGEAHIRATWEIDGQPRSDEMRAAPEVQIARAATGEALLQPDMGTAPIGETGVRVALDPESALDGVALRVRIPGPEANPPAGVGSPWWCAMLAVEGLPEGAGVYAVVPLRQPLPPGAKVELFAERGGGWERLEDQGQATADGQFVAFRHPGGTVAAGVTSRVQTTGIAQLPGPGAVAQPQSDLVTSVTLRVTIVGPFALPPGQNSFVHWIYVSNVGTVPAGRTIPVQVAIFKEDRTPLTYISAVGISGGFTCTLDANNANLAFCTSQGLAAGSSGQILLGSNRKPGTGGELAAHASQICPFPVGNCVPGATDVFTFITP